MNQRNIWEIEFDMTGPITIKRDLYFAKEKGFDKDQFYSEIRLEKNSYGIKATITAYAQDAYTAERVAFVYFSRMRDVLTFTCNLPIELDIADKRSSPYPRDSSIRRRIEEWEFKKAFQMARSFESEHETILRALSWYSKGKRTQNSLDQFLAFWNVIEMLGKKYHTETERTDEGIKNIPKFYRLLW